MKYINTIVLSLFLSLFATPALAQTYYNQYNQPYQPYNGYGYNYQGYAPTNRIPQYLSNPVTTATVGEGYVYGVRAEDPNGNAITYTLVQAPSGMAMNPSTHVIVWTPTQAGTYPVTISAADYTNQPAFQNFSITVGPSRSIATTQSTGVQTTSTSKPAGDSYLSGVFGGTSNVKTLTISNIKVESGPRNVNSQVSNANCGATVSWTTNIDSVGQVVYGTKSQPNPKSYRYEQAAIEGSSPSTIHAVTLPSCLLATTYRFRVVAAANGQIVTSDEQTIMPMPIEVSTVVNNQIISVEGTGSALGTIGGFFLNPFFLVILLGIVVFVVVKRMAGKGHGDGHGGGGHDAPGEEPAIAIPHH